MHLVSSVLIKRGTALCNCDVCALNWSKLEQTHGAHPGPECRDDAGNGGLGPARAGRARRPRGGEGAEPRHGRRAPPAGRAHPQAGTGGLGGSGRLAERGDCLNIPRSEAPGVQLPALSWGSGHTSLSPCQFLRRQQVLQLYRKILRAIREVPAEQDRRYLKDWAREEFRRNKDATEEVRIGNPQLWSPAFGNGHCTAVSCD